jgi:hypothetical protein
LWDLCGRYDQSEKKGDAITTFDRSNSRIRATDLSHHSYIWGVLGGKVLIMRRWIAVVAVVLGVVGMSRPLVAQGNGAAAVGQRPAVNAPRPSGAPTAERPASQPPSTDGPFTSRMMFVPRSPEDGSHVRVPFDSRVPFGSGLGFGVVGFPFFRPYSPISGGMSAGVFVSPPEGGPTGGLQLDVEQRRAQVYVDGAYVGLVADFSGYFHHLDLVAGPHVIEILAPDFEPLIIEVLVSPGHTTTYRGALTRAQGR